MRWQSIQYQRKKHDWNTSKLPHPFKVLVDEYNCEWVHFLIIYQEISHFVCHNSDRHWTWNLLLSGWTLDFTNLNQNLCYKTHSKKHPGRGAGRGADLSATLS